MKKALLMAGSALLVSSLVLFASCEKEEEKAKESAEEIKEPETKEPAQEQAQKKPGPGRRGPGGQGAAAGVEPVSPAEYWEIQIERLAAISDHYKKTIDIYESEEPGSEKLQEELRKQRMEHQKNMRDIFTSHGVSGREFYGSGTEDRKQLYQTRQQHLQDNDELKNKYRNLTSEIRELREKMKEYMEPKGGQQKQPAKEEAEE